MLTKEQLQDAVNCAGISCMECKMRTPEYWCQAELAKAALELMDEVDRLREIIFAR